MTTEQAIKEIVSSDYGRIQCHEETMHMAVEALKAQQWISVKDRLPENNNDDWYSVVLTHRFRGERLIRNGYFDYCRKQFYGFGIGQNYDVTHWMPMPKPPEEENKNDEKQ